jgi:hypothetical protein
LGTIVGQCRLVIESHGEDSVFVSRLDMKGQAYIRSARCQL